MPRNQRLYREDEPLNHLYVVGSGSFKLVRHSEEGREFIVSLSGRGEAFGAMVEPSVATVEARGLQDSAALAVPLNVLRRALEKRPEIGLRLVTQTEEKLRASEIRAARLAFESVPRRLASLLLETADRSTGLLRFPLNQSELAQFIGSSRETVCSILNQLRREGIVDTVGGRVHIIDRRGLETTS
ncbi:MAG: Crp/Fnr family transcriptional regulator [Vicinamibacteria bacterium]